MRQQPKQKLWPKYRYKITKVEGYLYPRVQFDGGLHNAISYELEKLNKEYELVENGIQVIALGASNLVNTIDEANADLLKFAKIIEKIDNGIIKKRNTALSDTIIEGDLDGVIINSV
jgi:hypothetical protein